MIGYTRRCSHVVTLGLTVGLLSLACNGHAQAEAQLLIEASTGKVLHAENATYPWYPASVTKLMTAYVAFEALKAGTITPDTKLICSGHGAGPKQALAERGRGDHAR